ncbi:unnamed protein product [Streptomyces laurentii]|uniref:Uncharacterized protein n=1 Tax=Streptomyces laurentii TaxID=39478 RepID=A0A160P7S2_STRLU|nr:unnamed protein product [Streptomyces laurentii]
MKTSVTAATTRIAIRPGVKNPPARDALALDLSLVVLLALMAALSPSRRAFPQDRPIRAPQPWRAAPKE